ncbi:hypothetical protein [Chlorogloeopsis sp. ULAP01]|uniref:hypothetical protein n=1 Tax=Chlorogloeopsis sp. ULAP01 TaxID=3056483 RepID=UPI0030142642
MYTPVGMDIGAETPKAIALSIIAEIQAVLTKRRGVFLRDRTEPIHSRSQVWIQFCDRPAGYTSKGMKIPQILPKETIPINTPLSLKINLDCPGSYLLLFNRGQDKQGNITKYLVTPSQAFAPSYQLLEKSILIPQQDAILYEDGIEFDAEGKEEYIGIVIDNPLNLPWLNPDTDNPALEWQGKHLKEVWEQLHAQDKWRVFYRNFNVISAISANL